MHYRVTNTTRNTLLGDRVLRAETFWAQFVGLMGQRQLLPGQGLHLARCKSIHTFFMRIAIDVAFVDASLRVVDVCATLIPWRTSRIYFEATSVLEFPAGTLAATQTQPGDQLSITPNSLPSAKSA
jgi:uncharacterized protein